MSTTDKLVIHYEAALTQIVKTLEVHDPDYGPVEGRETYGRCLSCGSLGYNFHQMHATRCPAYIARTALDQASLLQCNV